MEDRLTGSNGDVREKPSITPELTTDGGSEYASAVGTPTKETFETPLNSDSSTETLEDIETTGGGKVGSKQGQRTVSASRQPVAPGAQPLYVPQDLPKLLPRDPVEPSEVKLPLDDDDYVPPAPQGTRNAESTPLLPPPTQQSRARQEQRVRPRTNTEDPDCCTCILL